jgi:hypothetical protein
MNHSIYSVDRGTHLKIVVIALAAAITMASIAISSHISSNIDAAVVVKAGKPASMASSNLPLTR